MSRRALCPTGLALLLVALATVGQARELLESGNVGIGNLEERRSMKELSFDSETGEDYHETMRGYLRKFQEDEMSRWEDEDMTFEEGYWNETAEALVRKVARWNSSLEYEDGSWNTSAVFLGYQKWARWNSSMAFADGEWGWNETEAEYKAASWGGLSNDTLDFQEEYERLVARFNETMDLEDASWNATVDLEYSDEWGLNDTRAFRYKYRKALELNASADGEGLTIWLNPCEVEQGSSPVAVENLVLLPAGDSFDVSTWLDDPERANWDIIILYYGKNENFSCPGCKAMYRATGPKWRLVWGLTLQPEWQEIKAQYQRIMVPDDDLTMDTCTINTVFSAMKSYDLLMAQPSVCDTDMSYTLWAPLYQHPDTVLRFVSMVEIMAPTFDMEFFDNFIRPSLHNAHFGWGLDFVWPYLLRYPVDRFAVIDLVCMAHPPSLPNKANSLYKAAAPFTAKEEEILHYLEYAYKASEIAKLGFRPMPVEVLGWIPKAA